MITNPQDFKQKLLDIQNSVNVEYTKLPLNEPHFIINANTRTITIPSEFGFIGVKNDHKAENIYFEIDRYFDDEDLSNHTCIVQYSYKEFEGIYPVTSLDVESIDGKILFCWTIMNDATRDFGDINFSVRFYSIENDEYTYNFNTLTASSKILDTLDVNHYPYDSPTPEQFQIYIDKTNEISDKMDNFTTTVTESENKAKEYANDSMRYRDETRDISVEEIEKIQQAAETKEQEVIANIETKQQDVLASIPEDYTNLNNEIDGLKGDLDNIVDGYINLNIVENEYVDTDGTFKAYNGWSRSDFIKLQGVTLKLEIGYESSFNVFYDSSKTFISSFVLKKGTNIISVPDNAKYFVLSATSAIMNTVRYPWLYYEKVKENTFDINNLVLNKYVDDRTTTDKTYDTSIECAGDVVIELYNNSDADGYCTIRFLNNEVVKDGLTTLVSANSTVTKKLHINEQIDSILLINTNSKDINIKVYSSYKDELINLLSMNYRGVIVVDSLGRGHTKSIKKACDIAKANYDVQNDDVLIYVRNGNYVADLNTSSVASIDKGANRISIIGESRDGVVITLTNTGTTQNKVLDIGGKCTIQNLTIKCLHDETYQGNSSLANPYCLHNDTYYSSADEYVTEVKNCLFYSECYPPVGAGLRKNQRQIYKDVECIFNSNIESDAIQGSLYVHSPNVASENTGCSLVVDGCTLISYNGTRALMLPRVVDISDFTNIPVTIRRTIGVTNGSVVTNVEKGSEVWCHNLTFDSALNNMEKCNY